MDKNNYYYKLAAFRKNFKKKDGKYVALDFSYLQDLASLDMKIRAILLNIAIDVEHFIKVELSRQINNNLQEDGYSILTEFKNSQYNRYYEFTKKKFRESRYQNAMFNKRKHDYPYWALLEHMDYGCLIKFVTFYYQKHGCKSLKKASELGDGARHIRNACAHNSVLLLNVFEKNDKLSNVNAVITTFAKQVDVIKYKNYKKVNDLISLLVLAKAYCSPAVLHYHKQAINNFIVRCQRNQSAYAKNVELTKMMVVFKKIVDIL